MKNVRDNVWARTFAFTFSKRVFVFIHSDNRIVWCCAMLWLGVYDKRVFDFIFVFYERFDMVLVIVICLEMIFEDLGDVQVSFGIFFFVVVFHDFGFELYLFRLNVLILFHMMAADVC